MSARGLLRSSQSQLCRGVILHYSETSGAPKDPSQAPSHWVYSRGQRLIGCACSFLQPGLPYFPVEHARGRQSLRHNRSRHLLNCINVKSEAQESQVARTIVSPLLWCHQYLLSLHEATIHQRENAYLFASQPVCAMISGRNSWHSKMPDYNTWGFVTGLILTMGKQCHPMAKQKM